MSLVDTTESPAQIHAFTAESIDYQMTDYFVDDFCNTSIYPKPELYSRESGNPSNTTDDVAQRIVSGSRNSPALQLIQQLNDLIEISQNDGESTSFLQWPNKTAFDDAYTFILKLPLAKIPLPKIQLAEDGEISFLWNGNGCYVDLGFYGTGTYSYFGHSIKDDEVMGEKHDVSEGLAGSILQILSA